MLKQRHNNVGRGTEGGGARIALLCSHLHSRISISDISPLRYDQAQMYYQDSRSEWMMYVLCDMCCETWRSKRGVEIDFQLLFEPKNLRQK